MLMFAVQVECTGMGFCQERKVYAHTPMQACEAAERLSAQDLYGDDWAKVVHEFFAYKVRQLDAAEVYGWGEFGA